VFLTPALRRPAAMLRDQHRFAVFSAGGAPMLTDSQRDALVARLRQNRTDAVGSGDPGQIPARRAGLTELPLSYAQEQVWFMDRFAPGLPNYNIPYAIRVRGPLDPEALRQALLRLTERHEALRTRLVPVDIDSGDGATQVVDPPAPLALATEDLAGLEPAQRNARMREFIHAETMRPFDLAAGPLLRCSLVRLAADEHLLFVVVHHVIFDGWSGRVFVRDLAALYASSVTKEPDRLAELPVQLADYAIWERERIQGSVLTELTAYWRRALDGFETLQFPTDRPRPVVENFAGALAERTTSTALLAGLRQLARREGATLFATVLAGLLALLNRYTGQTDLVVGTVSANRGRPELTPLIGFLVSTLPIRCDASGDPSFSDLLARVKESFIGALAHAELPFGTLIDALKIARDASRAPLFQIAFTYAEPDEDPVAAADVDFTLTDLVRGIDAAKSDLTFAVEARRDGLWIECTFKTALFDAATVERLLDHLETLLHGAVADPGARLSALPLLTEAEVRAELTDWNDTAGPVPPGCVHERFEEQVSRTPGAVAAEYEGERLSYAELNRLANQVAQRLRGLGVGPEMLAGVCMETGLRRLAALLGVWKAGGGYVPLDPGLPAERLSFMIADTGMTVILTDDASAESVPEAAPVSVVGVDAEWDHITGLAGDKPSGAGVTPEHAAYVIYTSGSTGQPKGVVIEHRNAVNSLHSMIGHWQIRPGDAMLQFASLAFDASVEDTFMPLLAGARVVLAPIETLHSPSRLARLLLDARIGFVSLTPAVLDLLPAGEYPDLRVLMAGGDELPAEVARRWMRPGLRLVNVYGPTETTVNATYAELDAATLMPPPIGSPARPNYQAYVLDPHLNPVPPGVAGELHIGGASVARGYLNRPDLTRQRFIPDPFNPGQRLYKTGDLARRRPDGTLVYAGRIDNQVKIRGFRIELGEIEAMLARHPAVAQAVATVVTSPAGEKEIAAYLRPVADCQPDAAAVRAHVARALPPAMIPAHLITVETFPLNASGKIDKRRLPAPVRARRHGQEPAATPTESALAGLYATVLGTAGLGVTDGFFDLGGTSLTAMRLVHMIGRETGVDLGVTEVFLHPSVRDLAASVDAIRTGASPRAASGPVVELTAGAAGPRMFLIHAVSGTISAYPALAQELAPAFSVHGFQSPGLDGTDVIDTSLADLVSDYAQRIRAVQPTGPYRLAGWSMGGVVAFEIARQLERAGADVRLLVLLDAPFAIPAGYVSADHELAARFVADAMHSLGLDAADAPDPAAASAASQLVWLADRLAGDTAGSASLRAGLERRFGLFAAHSRMLAGYRPGAGGVTAPTLIVSAADSLNAPAAGQWQSLLTSGPVSVLEVTSDHYAFLRPPLVTRVASAMREWQAPLDLEENPQIVDA
jgi:amino acid adenylation domain-containing protein